MRSLVFTAVGQSGPLSRCFGSEFCRSLALLDVIVVDLSVQQRLDTGLEAQLVVVDLAARLDELGHAHAQDVDWLFLLGRHNVRFFSPQY